jgi:agmatine deiminase
LLGFIGDIACMSKRLEFESPPLTPSADSPAALGYRFPAEWEPHAATWLAWPHKPETWPGKFEPIPGVWAELVRTISRYEPVRICCGGETVMQQAQQLVGHLANVTLHDFATNDVWARDHGPMFLVPNNSAAAEASSLEPALVDWEYNAWGGKYPPFDLDNAIPAQIATLLGMRRFTPGIIMEGGAVDGDGQGTLLTTEQCLLNPNRNPHLSREQVEQYLADYCGTRKVLWLGEGIEGDDTDGHIDELARFVGPATVVCSVEENPKDANHGPLGANFQRLMRMTDAAGTPLRVVPLPMPEPLYYDDQRLPASYMNFYIANGVVVVPTFDQPTDAAVLQRLTELFPQRHVRGINAVDLFWGLGAFHCITQQQPVWE